jgi:cell division transport system permease protein
MAKRRKKTGSRHGLQAVTLCISTAMVLILLGLVVFSVLTARNLSTYVKQNIVVTLMLQDDMTSGEASQFCTRLKQRPYICRLEYISKEQALREGIKMLGADPREFADTNPFLSSIEITLNADYANTDSLQIISRELKSYPKVSEVKYQKDLIDSVNANIAKISIVLLTIALLLTIVSFSLINNTIRLSVYARRFSIHTMKLVGASWGFIRAPFVRRYMLLGLLAAIIACIALGGAIYILYMYEPDILEVLTWQVLAITAGTVVFFGLFITALCSTISVNKFLKMKAGDLYKI